MELSPRDRTLGILVAIVGFVLVLIALVSTRWVVNPVDGATDNYGLRTIESCNGAHCSKVELDSDARDGGGRAWRIVGMAVTVVGGAALLLLAVTVIAAFRHERVGNVPIVTSVAFAAAILVGVYFELETPLRIQGSVGPAFPVFLAGAIAAMIGSGALWRPTPPLGHAVEEPSGPPAKITTPL